MDLSHTGLNLHFICLKIETFFKCTGIPVGTLDMKGA